MQQGAAIAKTIEKRALTAEAQAKAPALATIYADGLSRLAQGDMSGMELLTRAQAESVGNPFLTAMTADVTKEGARMASMHVEKTLAEGRLFQDESQFRRTLKSTEDWRETQVEARDEDKDEQRLAARDAQAEREYNDQKAQAERENAARQQKNYERQAANRARQEAGETPEPFVPLPMLPMPEKPSFKSRTYGGVGQGEDTVEGVSFGAGVVNPTRRHKSKVQQNGPLFSPGEAPPMLPEDQVNPADTVSPETATPKSQPLVNEKPPEVVEQQVGGLVFQIPKGKDTGPKTSKTINIKTEFGSETITKKGDEEPDPAKQLTKALQTINRDPALSDWIGQSIMQGKRILVEPARDSKGKVIGYQPYRVGRDGIHEPFMHKSNVQQKDRKTGELLTNPDGSPLMISTENVAKTVTDEVANALNETIELMSGPMKGKFNFKLVGSEASNKAALEAGIDAVLNGGSIEEVNKELIMIHGMKPLTQEDIKAIRSRFTLSGKPLLKSQNDLKTWVPSDVIERLRKKHMKRAAKDFGFGGDVDVSQFLYRGL